MTVVTYKIVELHYIFKEHAQIYQKTCPNLSKKRLRISSKSHNRYKNVLESYLLIKLLTLNVQGELGMHLMHQRI